MNQSQRRFLIERIENATKNKIEELKRQETIQPPSLENYFYGLALTGKIQIQSSDHIKEVICKKALMHTAQRYSETWLGSSTGDLLGRAEFKIKIKDLFVVPSEYEEMWASYYKEKEEKDQKVRLLQIECDTLTTRIQLASDKTLEKMISEIDDMGNISLMDTKLRTLISNN